MKFVLAAAMAVASVQALVAPGTTRPTNPPATAKPTPTPTTAAEAVYEVTFSDFPRDQSCTTGTKLRTSKCFTTGGKSYRFGCRTGSNKVLTDSCDTGCTNCAGDWKSEGEVVNVCYDDGAFLFSYSCSAPSSGTGSTPAATPTVPVTPTAKPTSPPAGKLSCSALGWPTDGGSTKVCAQSRVDLKSADGCSGNVNFNTADGLCKAIGGRLCTSAELSNDEAKGTGCKLDDQRVWSSTECGNGSGVFTQSGARKGLKDVPVVCTPKTSRDASTRCCSDEGAAAGGSAPAPTGADGYPSGFFVASVIDYAKRDGSCRIGTPLKTSTCWADTSGNTRRFSCKAGETAIYYQSCGKDATCDPANCKGEWATDLETSGPCYTGSSTYYEYKCSV